MRGTQVQHQLICVRETEAFCEVGSVRALSTQCSATHLAPLTRVLGIPMSDKPYRATNLGSSPVRDMMVKGWHC